MKKLFSIFLLIGILVLTGCGAKNVPAEIIILNENQEETIYQIHITDNPQEVKENFKALKSAKTNSRFNGVSLEVESDISGKAVVNESSTIDLGYTIKAQVKSNLKQYRMAGNVSLEGFTNTESESLSLRSKHSLSLDVFNDDDFLYFKGNINTGNSLLTIKNKLGISEFTQANKTMIQSYIDLLKYYKAIDLINTEQWIENYQITIISTKKDSFTIRLHIPSKDIFPEIESNTLVEVDVEMDCDTILPIGITVTADQVIQEILMDQYVKDYLTENVQIQKPKFSIAIHLQYGYYTIQDVPTAEKELYLEYKK